MIKGVNKQVLEVTHPESPYFDRVLFFVSANGAETDEEKLRGAAQKIVSSAQKPPKTRRTKEQILLNVIYTICGIGAGAVLMLVLSTVI
ncbi:MAG: hypothetical protein IKF64_01150 [Eubacterium sp.]|nr:hypothetical protein [Eubacterium sp.]